MKRGTAIALFALVLVGGGIVLLVAGGDDTGDAPPPAETSTSSKPEMEKEPKEEEPAKTDEEQVEEVVTEYIERSSEDETVECDLVVDDACVQNESEVDLSSVEQFLSALDVSDVQVQGDEARAELNRGGSFSLRREDGDWKISGFEPPARPDRSGGVDAPERPEAPKPDGSGRFGGAEAP